MPQLQKAQQIAKTIIEDFDNSTSLNQEQIHTLIAGYMSIAKEQEICQKIPKGSFLVAGDIHGDITILKQIISLFLSNQGKIDHLIFLGDFVDRGSHSIGCLAILYSLVISHPKRVHLIRGNHEALSVNARYGFKDEVKKKLGSLETYRLFNESFGQMPVMLLHQKLGYFFIHGGLSVDNNSLDELCQIPKGDQDLQDNNLKQLLWNDPKENIDYSGYSMRGMGVYTFGQACVEQFLETNDLNMIIRAHEAFPEGYRYFFDKKLLSLFSSEEHYSYVNAKVAYFTSKGEITIFHPRKKPDFLD
ncbi:serine/threonine protein phosphatase [Candidatus Heimdallarchaeota archaeon]|nr:MAG: serine/threonine protein phosphatase [Candidatus Heimdallarchaeota archaeon]